MQALSALPVAVRQMCAIGAGDLVVLAAEYTRDLLILQRHLACRLVRCCVDRV